jgi:hypothetical protein
MAMITVGLDDARGSFGSPYTALWAAVVVGVVIDMDSKHKPDAVEAREWWWSTREDVGSLWWICEQLDLHFLKLQMMCATRQGRTKLLRKNWEDR